jgi:hypothetical protein
MGEIKQQLNKRLIGHRSDANCKPDPVYDEFFSCMCAAEFVCALDVFARHTSSRITFFTLTIVGRSRGDVSSHHDIYSVFSQRPTECHLSSHTILRSVIYPTSFVSTGQPYKNTQNCVKSSKNHPSWPSI